MWLAGFEQKAASVPGGTFDGSPIRLVLHTTEGGSIEGAVAAFAKTGSWPHFTVDPEKQRRQQHYPLSTSARALAHPKGSPETNRSGAIQVEIVGFAKDSHKWPAEVLEWLGREVVEPIHNALDFKLTYPPFVGVEAGTIATVNAAQRFTWAEWDDFNGVCGHQHVPGNDHWDPGRLDIAHVVAAVNAPDPEPTPVPHEEDDDMKIIKRPDGNAFLFAFGKLSVLSDAGVMQFAAGGTPIVNDLDDKSWTGIVKAHGQPVAG